MNGILSSAMTYIVPVAGVLALSLGYSKESNGEMRICNQQYALCTSAHCVPQPGDPTKAICSCDVEEGSSLATADCDSLKPSTDENGIRTVYSTYSFKQYADGKKAMKCPDKTP